MINRKLALVFRSLHVPINLIIIENFIFMTTFILCTIFYSGTVIFCDFLFGGDEHGGFDFQSNMSTSVGIKLSYQGI